MRQTRTLSPPRSRHYRSHTRGGAPSRVVIRTRPEQQYAAVPGDYGPRWRRQRLDPGYEPANYLSEAIRTRRDNHGYDRLTVPEPIRTDRVELDSSRRRNHSPVVVAQKYYADFGNDAESVVHVPAPDDVYGEAREDDDLNQRGRAHGYVPSPRHSSPMLFTGDVRPPYESATFDPLDFPPGSYANFALSAKCKGLFGSTFQSTDSESSRGPKEDASAANTTQKPSPGNETLYRIRFSSWPENGSGGEDPVADLVTASGTGSSRRSESLFEWVHIKQDVMSFDAFMRRVEDAPELDPRQRSSLSKTLRGISRQFEKPLRTQEGMQGRWMMPNFEQELRDGKTTEFSQDFLCIPFFSLEKYNPPALPENSRAHPKRTLLQTLFSSATKAQDYEQAVTKLPSTPKDHLFFVSQLWALVVNDKFIITCSSHDPSELVGDSVIMSSRPSAGISTTNEIASRNIEIDDGGIHVWLLPLEICSTWFLLNINIFESLDGTNLDGFGFGDIMYGDTPLTAEDWPRVFERAKKTTIRLSVRESTRKYRSQDLRQETDDGEDEEDTDSSEPQDKSVLPTALEKQSDETKFHVFTWLVAPEGTEDGPASEKKVTGALGEVHRLLFRESFLKDRKAYREVFWEAKTKKDSYDSVLHSLEELSSNGQVANQRLQYLSSLVRVVSKIFQFFVPLNCRSPATGCFWTALQRIIEQNDATTEPKAFETLRTYAKRVDDLSQMLSGLETPKAFQKNSPDTFVVAWVHLCLVLCHWNPSNMSAADHHLQWFSRMFDDALTSFLRNFQDKPLLERTAAMPLSIASLAVQQVLKDFTHSRPDVISSYWDYYNQLKRKVDEEPLNRVHQKRINFLKQEIDAIKAVLSQQQNVLNSFENALMQRRESSFPLLSDTYSIESNIIENAIAAVDAKYYSFDDMSTSATNLQETNLQMIDFNRDRQEAAIYAFTIVTIIFLPLSFVSGFLGMNTADVRDMSHGQWVFWAAGVPLTVLIIILGLAGAGELGNVWKAFLKLFSRQPSERRWARMTMTGAPPELAMDEEVEVIRPVRRRTTGALVRRETMPSGRRTVYV